MFCNDAQNPLKTPMISSAQYFQTLEELSFWLPTIKILIMTKKCSLIINRKFAEPAFSQVAATIGDDHHRHPNINTEII